MTSPLLATTRQRAHDAVEVWANGPTVQQLDGPFFGLNSGVVMEVKPFQGDIRLSFIWTPPDLRGKGLSSAALKDLLAIADQYRVPVTLRVHPDKSKGLTAKELAQWYMRHGFVCERGMEFRRAPQTGMW